MIAVPYWRLWYEDGSRFSSEDGLPHESPPFGVILVTQRTEQRFDDMLLPRAVGEHQWFIWRDDYGCWLVVDQVGFWDHMVHHAKEVTAVRPGRYVLKPVWKDACRAAQIEIDTWQRKVES